MRFEIVEQLKKLPPESPLPGCKHIPCRVVGTIPWRWKRYERVWTEYGFEPDDFASTIILWWIEKTDPSYDPTRGASAATLAINSIKWAIDYALRTIASGYGPKGDDLIRRKLLVSRPMSIHFEGPDGEEGMHDIGREDLEHEAETDDDVANRFDDVLELAGIMDVDAEVLRGRFLRSETLESIGKRLGWKTSQRARQIEARAIARLREFMGDCSDFAAVLARERSRGRWSSAPAKKFIHGPATVTELAIASRHMPTRAKPRNERGSRRAELLATGVCLRCKHPRGDSPSRVFCSTCFEIQRANQKEFFKRNDRTAYYREARDRRLR